MNKLLPFKLNDANMLRLVRETALHSENIYLTKHAKKRMRERGISRTQIEYCLRSGNIDEPAHVTVQGNWRCCLRCVHAGDLVKVVVDLEKDEASRWLMVVTVF